MYLPDSIYERAPHYWLFVGMLLVRILGARGTDADAFAIATGEALQLTNILRDVVEDAGEGRTYLPREWLEEAGVVLPEIQTLIWFTVTIVGVTLLGGRFIHWPVLDQVVAINVLVSLALFKPLGHVGLALATTTMAVVNAGLLYRHIRRDNIYLPPDGWWSLILKSVLASVAMGGMLFWFAGSLEQWVSAGGWWKVGRLSLLVVGGVVVYFGLLFLTGVRKGDFHGKPSESV